jgi:hypothetical protein
MQITQPYPDTIDTQTWPISDINEFFIWKKTQVKQLQIAVDSQNQTILQHVEVIEKVLSEPSTELKSYLNPKLPI